MHHRLRNHQKLLALLLALLMSFSLTGTAFAAIQESPSEATNILAAETAPEALNNSLPTTSTASQNTNPNHFPSIPNAISQNSKIPTTYDAGDLTYSNSDLPRILSKSITTYSSGTTITPPTTSEEVYRRLTALQSVYREGDRWTNDYPYGKEGATWGYVPNSTIRLPDTGVYITSSRGCAAIGFEVQDNIFGDAPSTVFVRGQFRYSDVHVGDHLRLYDNSHSVIVWQVTPAGCIVIEGNYGGRIHWGRVLSVAEVLSSDYLITRWPAGQPVDTDDPDGIKSEGKIGNLDWNITNKGILTISGTGAIPDYNNVDNKAPWADLNYNTAIIENGITKIGNGTFYESEITDTGKVYHSSLTKVVIPGTVKVIGANAFRDCTKLISASLPDGVQEIGDNAFNSCTGLTRVDMPGTLTKLGSSVLAFCDNLQTLIFTNSKTGTTLVVGDSLITGCRRLQTVILPSNLPEIGDNMFQSCTLLNQLAIPKSVTRIGRNAFSSSYVTKIYYEGSRNDWYQITGRSTNLSNLGLTLIGTTEDGQHDLDVAIANSEIVVNYPFINPFSTDASDLTTSADATEHQHTWSTGNIYGKDSENHWRICTDNNCPDGAKVAQHDVAPHDFSTGDCVCGEKAPVPAHEHHWSETWEKDRDYHWHICEDENCPDPTAVSDRAFHVYPISEASPAATNTTEATEITDATNTTDTVTVNNLAGEDTTNPELYETVDAEKSAEGAEEDIEESPEVSTEKVSEPIYCTVCGYEQPQDYVDPNHAWSTEWTTDTTENGNHHWHICINPEHPNCPTINNYGEHIDEDENGLCDICSSATTEVDDNPITPVNPPAPATPNEPSYIPNFPSFPDISNMPTSPSSSPTSNSSNNNDHANSDPTSTTNSNDIVTTTTLPTGEIEININLPSTVIESSIRRDSPISLPISAIQAARDINTAPTIIFQTEDNQTARVAIPAISPSASTVVALINPDGSTNIIKISTVVGDSIITTLPGDTVIKIIDNHRFFSDVSAGAWSADAIDFVTARELFSGTSADIFSPATPMTRAMLMTVLARLDGTDTSTGTTWYERGIEWAISHGISDGSNPDGNITREQLVAMLWRYLGSPNTLHDLSDYTDSDSINDYAIDAMRWAVNAGIISGLGNGRLDPQGQATREQVSQFLKNLIEYLVLNPA